ncbi:MAG: hypothetical protein LBT05_04170 [Planctomycetaceae bacterium]|nr:hypothetical protein [Planctomycetaceae bacterium]
MTDVSPATKVSGKFCSAFHIVSLPAGTKPEDVPEERRNQTSPDIPITNSD